MTAVTFGGIVSGIDTNTLIDKLVSIEKSPETAIKQRQSDATARSGVISTLVSRLQSLSSLAEGMSTAAGLKSLAASSSDTSRVQIAASGAASVGTHSVSVSQLAQSQVSLSQSYSGHGAGVAGDGSVSITIGGNPPVTVTWTSSNSLDDIAANISSQTGIGASVIYDGTSYHIVMQGASGSANAFTTSGSMSFAAPLQPALDAKFTIDQIPITRSSNVVSDALPGLTLTLGSVTPDGGAATNLTISNDPAGLKTKLQSLVDSYNAISSMLTSQLSYNGVARGADTLFGDPGAQALQRQLGALVGDRYSDAAGTVSAAEIGISLDRSGVMKLDATKLAAADPAAVQRLLVGTGRDGLAQAIQDLSKRYTDSTEGVLTTEQTGLQTQVKAYDDQIARIEARASALETRLQTQFTAMEKLMQAFQTQQSYLTSVFASSSSSSSKK